MAVLRPEQLSSHLSGPLAPLYVLHGNAPLLVEEAADAIRAAARSQGVTEREILVTGQGFRWEQLAMASGKHTAWYRRLRYYTGSKMSAARVQAGTVTLANKTDKQATWSNRGKRRRKSTGGLAQQPDHRPITSGTKIDHRPAGQRSPAG